MDYSKHFWVTLLESLHKLDAETLLYVNIERPIAVAPSNCMQLRSGKLLGQVSDKEKSVAYHIPGEKHQWDFNTGQVPYYCIPLANRVLRHYVKREDAREDDNEARVARHQAALERLHPILTAAMTAVSRTEGRLGLAHRPKEHEVQILLVREFGSLNDTLVSILDVLKAMVYGQIHVPETVRTRHGSDP